MSARSINFNTYEDQLKFYHEKTLEELQMIQPKWAYGKDANKALSYFQDQINSDYRIFLLTPSDLIENVQLNEISTKTLFTGNTINDGRIVRILSRWDNNEFVDPPTICFSNENEYKLSFSDGRHRAKLTYFLKQHQMPVAIHNADIGSIKEIIQLSLT